MRHMSCFDEKLFIDDMASRNDKAHLQNWRQLLFGAERFGANLITMIVQGVLFSEN